MGAATFVIARIFRAPEVDWRAVFDLSLVEMMEPIPMAAFNARVLNPPDPDMAPVAYSRDVVEVTFAKAFRRHVECPSASVAAGTVGEALAGYFECHPQARGYVLDDVGAVRKHVAVFVNDDLIVDRTTLADPVGEGDRIHVFQALSGGSQ